MNEYNENLCLERHKRLEEKLSIQDIRINNHSSRIDKLEQSQASINTKIENLCEQIRSLVSIMKWYISLTVGALTSFFFYCLQHGLFK